MKTKTTTEKAKLDHDPILALDIANIYPSPENDKVYKPIDPADPAIVALAQSVREHGIMEPLLLTADHYILSGHRRFAAAKLAGLRGIPCRIRHDVSHAGNPDQFMQLLREANRQRVKSFEEKLREEVVRKPVTTVQSPPSRSGLRPRPQCPGKTMASS